MSTSSLSISVIVGSANSSVPGSTTEAVSMGVVSPAGSSCLAERRRWVTKPSPIRIAAANSHNQPDLPLSSSASALSVSTLSRGGKISMSSSSAGSVAVSSSSGAGSSWAGSSSGSQDLAGRRFLSRGFFDDQLFCSGLFDGFWVQAQPVVRRFRNGLHAE